MITNIDVIKNNIIGNCNLLSVFNPLIFKANVTYSGAPPDNLYWYLKNIDGLTLYYGRCTPVFDITIGLRQFIVNISPFVKKFFSNLNDFYQPTESVVFVENTQLPFSITFADPDNVETMYTAIDFYGFLSTRQRGQTEANTEQYNNDNEYIIAPKGFPVYVYFYNNDVNNTVKIGTGIVPPDPPIGGLLNNYNDIPFVSYNDKFLESSIS